MNALTKAARSKALRGCKVVGSRTGGRPTFIDNTESVRNLRFRKAIGVVGPGVGHRVVLSPAMARWRKATFELIDDSALEYSTLRAVELTAPVVFGPGVLVIQDGRSWLASPEDAVRAALAASCVTRLLVAAA